MQFQLKKFLKVAPCMIYKLYNLKSIMTKKIIFRNNSTGQMLTYSVHVLSHQHVIQPSSKGQNGPHVRYDQKRLCTFCIRHMNT